MPERNVLCVSFDKVVSDARCAALQQAGYAVTTATQMAEAVKLLAAEKFALVVIGHRFPKSERHQLAQKAKEAQARVLLICGSSADSEIPADARVYALEGVEGLVAAASKLLSAAAKVEAA